MPGSFHYGSSATLPSIRGHFHRPRIDRLLSSLSECCLIAVAAGAGSGKTHAVASYLQNAKARVYWFQLSRLDNDVTRFWDVFLHIIGSQSRETAAQLGQLGFPESVLKFNRFLSVLAKDVYAREQVVFVFDDFYLINDDTVLRFVLNLVHAKLENLCIIINSRNVPRINLTGMLADGSAGLITTEELSFTREETGEYLRQQGIPLSARELEQVQRFTGGWPLALYLVGLSMKHGMISHNPVAQAVPLIFDMLERELFSEYSPVIRNFLIRVSLLDSFPEELVLMLAGEHRDEVLEFLGGNMFVSGNTYTGQYTFHRLFLDFLGEKQRLLSPEETEETYLTAAAWCSGKDLKIDALRYYDKCGRHDEILKLINSFGVATFSKSVAEFYIGLIGKLPSKVFEENPLLHVHRAGLLCNNAEVREAIDELLATEKELEARQRSDTVRAALGEVNCLLGVIYLGMADYEFAARFRRARELLPNGSALINSRAMAVNTRYAIMLGSSSPGELARMEKAMFTAISDASAVMDGYGQGMDYLASAEAAYLTGDFKNAAKNAFEAIYRAREKHVSDVVSSGYFLLMRIHAAGGDYAGVLAMLEQLHAYVGELEDRWNFNGMPDVADGWFNLLFGSAEKIAGWLVDDRLGSSLLAPYSMGMERSIKARYLLREGKYYELLAWLEQSEKLIRQYRIRLLLLDFLICKAIALHHISNPEGSLNALSEAYGLAHGNGLVMQFAELGNELRPVIYGARRGGGGSIPDAWLDEINAKAGTYEKHLRDMRVQYDRKHGKTPPPAAGLTKREREVLILLCRGLTNSEIAETCFITVSAVKKTLNKIYIKLDATNRADAVRTAIQHELNR